MCTLLARRDHSTILEGQRLGTVHIIEVTCSRLRFFLEKYEHRHVHVHIHINNYVHTFIKIHVQKQVRVRGWLCGWVVSLSLVFSNLKLVRSKGFFR